MHIKKRNFSKKALYEILCDKRKCVEKQSTELVKIN